MVLMGFLLIKPKTQPNHCQKVGFFHPWKFHVVQIMKQPSNGMIRLLVV